MNAECVCVCVVFLVILRGRGQDAHTMIKGLFFLLGSLAEFVCMYVCLEFEFSRLQFESNVVLLKWCTEIGKKEKGSDDE